MLTIKIVEAFGFVNYAVILDDIELVRFEKYGLAVDFIRTMEDLG